MNRRRFLEIAAFSGLGTVTGDLFANRERLVEGCWRGIVMGTEGSITLYANGRCNWERLHLICLQEIQRLERIFSLYEARSEISCLNRNGRLSQVSPEFFEVLELSRTVWTMTKGGFNPSVQPMWSLYRDFYDKNTHSNNQVPVSEIEQIIPKCDFEKVVWSQAHRTVAFSEKGMALTFNGIAQGYITDRISDLLKEEGFEHVLVQLGETRAMGSHGSGRSWRIRLNDGQVVSLVDRALASSGGYGTPFSANGKVHHLLNPRTGVSANRFKLLSVLGDRAAFADALSTGLYVTDPVLWPDLVDVDVITA